MEDKRIFICGPSGCGKTTLAKWIAATYRIPFISTSGKALWEELDIKDHADLIAKSNRDPQFAIEYQIKLLTQRLKVLSGHENFVTDRSPIDNLVYYLMQVASHASDETTDEYIEQCHGAMKLGTKIIYTPFSRDIELEKDGSRIDSVHFQMYTSGIFDYVLERNLLDLHTMYTNDDIMHLGEWDWGIRMARVQWLLSEPNRLQKFLKKRWLKRNS